MAYDFHHTKKETWTDYVKRHKEWGWHTFGSPADGRNQLGPYDHIGKEIKELHENPTDLKEWIDVAILSIDGMLRAGAPDAGVAYTLERFYTGKFTIAKKTLADLERVYIAMADKTEEGFVWGDLFDQAVGGFLNAGGTLDQLLPMMFAKQEKNGLRDWPDWRNQPIGKAIEHVRGKHD